MSRREAERRARVREVILDAFVCLCAERGYAETTMAAVAERAGVGPADLRRHFADTEECGVAAENASLSAVMVAVARSYDPDRSEVDSLIAGIAAILEWAAENPAYAYFGFIAVRQMTPAGVRAVYETGRRTLGAMLERGRDYSHVPVRPTGIGCAVLGAAEAPIRRELASGRAERLPLLLPDCVYIATVPFLGQDEALRLMARARARIDRSVAVPASAVAADLRHTTPPPA